MKTVKSNRIGMFCTIAATALLMACGNNGEKEKAEIEKIKVETIAVHDEIMPQIATFDRQGLTVDTILVRLDSLYKANPSLDTAAIRQDLTQLKNRLDDATDQMMRWMMEFQEEPQGSVDSVKAYFNTELDKIKKMRDFFEEVKNEAAEKLQNF